MIVRALADRGYLMCVRVRGNKLAVIYLNIKLFDYTKIEIL